MVVLKLKSPLAAVALALIVLLVTGLSLLRVDTAWVMRSEAVVEGEWGSGSGEFGRGAGADGRPRGPQAIAADESGNVVVADSLNYRLQIFDRQGCLLEVVPVPAGAATPQTEDDRAGAYGLLRPSLDWGTGFRPRPEVVAPARSSDEPVPVAKDTGEALSATRPPYVTDIDLSVGAWRVRNEAGRIDPGAGPEIYLLAGWEGIVAATDAAGNLRWSRDLSTPERFLNLPDPSLPNAPPEPETWAGYLIDLDTFPGDKGLLVSGYELQPDKLVHFVRFLEAAEAEPQDLASYELVRDGSIRIDEAAPIGLEVESVAVADSGLLYIVAAGPPTGSPAAESGASPFARDIWIYTREGREKGKLQIDCGVYTRHLRLVGVDARGLVYARLGGPGTPGTLTVFDEKGRRAVSAALPEGAEAADAYLARDGTLYVSLATDEGYQVVRFEVRGHSRLVWRWAGHH